jgi:hypothetical protein
MCHTPQVARSMGVPLVPRRARVFDEINDIVGCDLVLVMDSFDATEVHPHSAAGRTLTCDGCRVVARLRDAVLRGI